MLIPLSSINISMFLKTIYLNEIYSFLEKLIFAKEFFRDSVKTSRFGRKDDIFVFFLFCFFWFGRILDPMGQLKHFMWTYFRENGKNPQNSRIINLVKLSYWGKVTSERLDQRKMFLKGSCHYQRFFDSWSPKVSVSATKLWNIDYSLDSFFY